MSIQKNKAEEPDAPAQTDAERATQLHDLEVAAKKLELLERQANLQDVQERLGERQLAREQIRSRAITNGQTIKQINRDKRAIQERCNHHKGGDGPHAIASGQGQDSQYAVMKHRFANNDLWVICLRCGKKWRPPIRKNYETQGEYDLALQEYKAACVFPTRNQTSTSHQFQWSDGGELYREAVANS